MKEGTPMDCKRCIERGKPVSFASDPKCAFRTGEFSSDNWNCATANELRSLAGEERGDTSSASSFYIRRNDQSYAALYVPANVNDVPEGEEIGPFRGGGFVVMSWYKHRGQTEIMLRVDPRNGGMLEKAGMVLTLDEAEAAIENIIADKASASHD